MSVEIAWKQNILVTDFHLLKSLLVVFCEFSRQNICSVEQLNQILHQALCIRYIIFSLVFCEYIVHLHFHDFPFNFECLYIFPHCFVVYSA